MNKSNAKAKLTACIATIVVLSLCLCLTTYALAFSLLATDSVLFRTGYVSINLNDGAPIIRENDLIFEPGATAKQDFFIENDGSGDVYFKIYFSNVAGGLADVITVTVMDGDETLFTGTPAELTAANAKTPSSALRVGERRALTAYFHFPENATNHAQALTLSFDVCADAVQAKNNPDRLFD